MEEANGKNLVLIHERKSLVTSSDFLSIGLCDVIYKIVTKVVYGHLKFVLP